MIIFLLWLWITNLALLFGAELDAEMERGRQLQAGIPAEREIQLPPRDTTTIDKKARRPRRTSSRASGSGAVPGRPPQNPVSRRRSIGRNQQQHRQHRQQGELTMSQPVEPNEPDQTGDVPDAPDGIGIGADSEPDTFEPEEPEES